MGLAGMLVACAGVSPEPSFESIARQNAIVRWQRGNRTVQSEALCEKAASRAVRVTVGSKPDQRLFRLESDGIMMARGWRGQVGGAPAELVVWSTFLTIYQNSDRLPVGERELHTPAARVAVKKETGGLRSVSILNTDNAQTLEVVFP